MMKTIEITTAMNEELLNYPLEVNGEVPKWLTGTLVRNGPVDVYINGQCNTHWFDGLAMLHAFKFDEGTILYSNKFLRSEAYDSVFEKGSLHYLGFATDPCRSIFKKAITYFFPLQHLGIHNANINVANYANDYVALFEIPLPVRFDPETLETLGLFEYKDSLPIERCWESAHPHTGSEEIFNYLVSFGRKTSYQIYKMEKGESNRKLIAEIPTDFPSYMHSFAVTENYILLTEFPFVVHPRDFMLEKKAFIENYQWEPERGSRFLVIDKKLGTIVKIFHTKPFFAFHHVNAYEKRGEIVLDIICYDDPNVVQGIASHFRAVSEERRAEEQFKTRLERFTLDLHSGEIDSTVLLNTTLEMPRISEKLDGKPYRYLYAVDPRDAMSEQDIRPLYKFDTSSKELKKWSEKGCYPGEPVFISAPNAEKEDEGVVVAVVLDHFKKHSFLLILDAKSFKEIGRAEVNHSIPAGLHGQFFTPRRPL